MFLGIDKHSAESLALRDSYGGDLSYGELVDTVAACANALSGRCLSFCLCRNEVGCVVGYLGMVEARVVPVMLDADMDRALLSDLITRYEPALIWAPDETRFDDLGSVGFTMHGYRLIDTAHRPYALNELLELCMSTSGSTGSPKLVRYKKGNLEANARNVARAFGWTPAERALVDLKLNYTMGLNVLNTHLYAGAAVLLTGHNIMGNDYWDFLKSQRATNITGVPFTFEVFRRLKFTSMDLPYLTTIAEGGGKLPDDRFEELARFAGENDKRFIATFGTTETAARMSMLPAGLAATKTGSIGRAIPEGTLFLVDEAGNEIDEPEAEGLLGYSGPNVAMGYAEYAEDLARGDEWDGTFVTGDLARRDSDGCYYITGRLSRFVKMLGRRIGLDECERIIRRDLDIDSACVGNDSAITVVCAGAEEAKRACACLKDRLKLRPSQCRWAQVDAIPRGTSGKVLYAKLEEELS